MTTQIPVVGKDILLEVGDGAASEAFTPIGGLRSTSCKINQGEIDVTSKDGSRWRKLIAGGTIDGLLYGQEEQPAETEKAASV